MITQPYEEKDSAEYELRTTEDVTQVLINCVFLESVLAGFVHGPAEYWPRIDQHTFEKISEYANLILPSDHVAHKSINMYSTIIEQTVEFVEDTAKLNENQDKLELWQVLCLAHQYLLSNVFIRYSIDYLLKYVPEEHRSYFHMNYFNRVWKEYNVEYKELKQVKKRNKKLLNTVKDQTDSRRLKTITDPQFLSFPWSAALNLEKAPKPF